MSRLLWVGAVLLAASASAIEVDVAGAPLRLKFSEYAVGAYHLDNGYISPPGSPTYDPTGSNYVDWINRFQVDASWMDFTLLLRLDSALFVNAPVAAPGNVRFERLLYQRYVSRVDLEKASLSWTSRHLDVTLGDIYATYGRGLVLALRKVDALTIDTSARGLSLTGKVGDLTVNALGGFSNIINVDTATGRTSNDPFDLIVGGHADYRVKPWLVPGVSASWVRLSRNAQDQVPQATQDQTLAISGSLEAPALFGWGSAYVEYARQIRTVGGLPYNSGALYVNASLTFGKTTLQAEFKDYRNYAPLTTSLDSTRVPELAMINTYSVLPTLERMEQAVKNNTDVTGARVRVDVNVTDSVTPFVSMAAFVDRIYVDTILDPYAGCEITWQEKRSRAVVSGGYRPSIHDGGQLDSSVWHAKYLVSQSIAGPYSVELNGLHMSQTDLVGGKLQPWMQGQAYLALKSASGWSAAFGYEYFTQAPETIREHYFNGNVSWTANRNLTLRAFGGGQRGGIKCVNGICRTYPAFSGVRLEVVLTY